MPVVDRHHRPIGIVSARATRSGSRFCIFAANCNCARTSRKSFDHAVPTGRPVAPCRVSDSSHRRDKTAVDR